MTKANEALVRRYFEDVLSQKNLGVCDEILATAFMEHAKPPLESEAPGAVDGPATMRESSQYLFDQLPDLLVTVEALMSTRDEVAARVTARGTATDAEGKALPFEAAQMHWFRCDGGKIVEHWAVRDDLTAMLHLYGIRSPT